MKRKAVERLVTNVPADVKQWVLDQAALNGATLGSVIAQACRLAMQRQRDEAAKDRARTSAAE